MGKCDPGDRECCMACGMGHLAELVKLEYLAELLGLRLRREA